MRKPLLTKHVTQLLGVGQCGPHSYSLGEKVSPFPKRRVRTLTWLTQPCAARNLLNLYIKQFLPSPRKDAAPFPEETLFSCFSPLKSLRELLAVPRSQSLCGRVVFQARRPYSVSTKYHCPRITGDAAKQIAQQTDTPRSLTRSQLPSPPRARGAQ